MLKHRERAVLSARRNFVIAGFVLAALIFSPPVRSQTDKPRSSAPTEPGLDGWGRPITPLPKDRKAALAPRHDISGIWDAGDTSGIQPLGAKAFPDDGKPGHQPPYTALGLEMLK